MRSHKVPESIPPDKDVQQLRIERGATVLGSDSPLGIVEQVIVDRDTGALTSLVVRGVTGQEFELSADCILRATGNEVHLSVSQAELAADPDLARPYTPELYAPVDQGLAVPPGQVGQMDSETPVVTDIQADAVELAAPGQSGDALEAAQVNATVPSLPDQGMVVIVAGEPELAEGPPLSDQLISDQMVPGEELAASDEVLVAEELMEEPGIPSALGPEALGLEPQATGNMATVVGLTLAGVLLGTATAGTAYLLMRRRRTDLPRATRQRLGDLRSTVYAARSAAARQLSQLGRPVRLPALWPSLASALGLMGLRLSHNAGGPLVARRSQAIRVAKSVLSAPAPGNLRNAVVAGVAQTKARGRQLSSRVAYLAQRVTSNVARRRRAVFPAAQTARVGRGASRARRRVARGARTAAHRIRWFRRGLIAGLVGGLLFAPVPGQTLRVRLAGALHRLPGLGGLLGGTKTASGGASGPHPSGQPVGSSPLATVGPRSVSGLDTPLLQPMSEEPLLPPSTDETAGELPSSTGL
jgi:hypothetical protein